MGAFASHLHGLGDVATVAPLVTQIARAQGVDPNLVMAVIRQESGFQIDPGNRPGDGYGLMQVTLPTAQQVLGASVTAADLMDPVTNITAGVRYLASQLARYGGNVADALAGYNGGAARRNASGQYVNTQGVPNVQRYVDSGPVDGIPWTAVAVGVAVIVGAGLLLDL